MTPLGCGTGTGEHAGGGARTGRRALARDVKVDENTLLDGATPRVRYAGGQGA